MFAFPRSFPFLGLSYFLFEVGEHACSGIRENATIPLSTRLFTHEIHVSIISLCFHLNLRTGSNNLISHNSSDGMEMQVSLT